MIPHLRDSDHVGSLPHVLLNGWHFNPGDTSLLPLTVLQVWPCSMTAHIHIPTQVPMCLLLIFNWVFLPLWWLDRGLGTVFSHCSPSEGKTNRLIMDFKVCLLIILEDAKGEQSLSLALRRASCPPHSVSLFCLFNHEFMKKKSCMLCVQYTEAETPPWAFYCTYF